MAWTAPMTAALNATFTSAQFNANVRDNLLETAPAKATTVGSYFVSTATNAIAQRSAATSTILTSQTTTSTSFVDLGTVGPSITIITGTRALVSINVQMSNSTANAQARASFAVSGATTIAAGTLRMVESDGLTAGSIHIQGATFMVNLTAGSNTFTMKYAVSAGTGTFSRREINVIPF